MSMRGLAAGLVITLQCAGALSASAADLYQQPYDAPRAEAPDDDPRYGDVYKLPPPPYSGPRNGQRYEPAPRYAERYDGPYSGPRPFIDRREYLPPLPHAPSFYDLRGRRAEEDGGCVPRYEIKRALSEDGWSEFHDLEVRDEVAHVRARRPNGEVYDLKVDRCSGRLLRAQAVETGQGPYAWRRREAYPAY